MQRLGKNQGGYFGERINVQNVLHDFEAVAREFNWTKETFHGEGEFKWLALKHSTPRAKFRVYISTGIHGDEPAGPLAALQLLRDNKWPEHAEIILLPCLNPIGFAKNTRENAQGIDLNRDYLNPQSMEIRAHVAWLEQQQAFDLCLCLHEDWESHGFYVYELNPNHKPSLAQAMIAGVAPVCPIDQSEMIEGRAAKGGIIRPSLDPLTRPLWPESFWLLQHKTRLSYTLEAPSDFPLAIRVNALVAGVHAALACALLNLGRPE